MDSMTDRRWIHGWAMVCCVLTMGGMLPAMGEEDVSVDGKPLSELLKQLKSENRGFQMRAARALSEAPTNARPQIIEQVLPVLKSPRENDKFVAAQVLGNCGPLAKAAIPDLLPMLKGTQYERNRAAAAKALGQILVDAQPSEEVEKVAEALAAKFSGDWDQYSDVRREAMHAIGMIGLAAKKVIPKLSKGLNDNTEVMCSGEESFMVRRQAAWVCGRMGPLAAEHMDRLVAMMNGERLTAPEIVEAIGKIGPVNDNVVPNMLNKLEHIFVDGFGWEKREVVENYMQQLLVALGKFGGKAAGGTELLTRMLAPNQIQGNPARAVQVLKTLGEIGPGAAKAAPVIENNCLKSQNKEVAAAGSEALKKIQGK